MCVKKGKIVGSTKKVAVISGNVTISRLCEDNFDACRLLSPDKKKTRQVNALKFHCRKNREAKTSSIPIKIHITHHQISKDPRKYQKNEAKAIENAISV